MKSGSYLRYVIGLLIALATVVIVCTWLKPAEKEATIIPVGESGNVVWDKPGTNAVEITTNRTTVITPTNAAYKVGGSLKLSVE